MKPTILIVLITAMLTASANAQSLYDPNTDSLYNQPSWQDRQEQHRLEREIRELEYENRRLRALREQQRNDQELRTQHRRTEEFRRHWNAPFPD